MQEINDYVLNWEALRREMIKILNPYYNIWEYLKVFIAMGLVYLSLLYFSLSRFLGLRSYALMRQGEDYKKINSENKEFKKLNLWVFVIEEFILLASVFLMYLIQKTATQFPEIVISIIGTGVHIPLIFCISTFAIKKLCGVFLDKEKDIITDDDLAKSAYVMLFYLDVGVLVIDWEFALFILVILVGKYVWFDIGFGTGSLLSRLKRILQSDFNDNPTGYTALVIYVGKQFICVLIILIVGSLYFSTLGIVSFSY